MKHKLFVAAVLSITASLPLYAQSVVQPWYVIDRGGGRSTSGSTVLQSSIGQSAVQVSSAGGTNLNSGFIPGLQEFTGATTETFQTDLSWNMVSVPLVESDFRKSSLYPTATSVAFAYTGSYQQRDTLQNLVGYWLKFPASKMVQFSGSLIPNDTLYVTNGWNMIGCLSSQVLISNIVPVAPTTISSNYFGFSGASGYFAEDTLQPGRGYWVKVNTTGKLVMNPSSVIAPSKMLSVAGVTKDESQTEKKMGTLTIRDAKANTRALSFSSFISNLDMNGFEMPPLPPSGLYDVRYASNRSTERSEPGTFKDVTILISSAEYPLTLSWNTQEEAALLIDGTSLPIKGTGETRISNSSSRIKLRLSPSHSPELPKEFALRQNFPNPFNPSTEIRFELPVSSIVTLKVYDLLGREVATLVDGMQEAGYKSAQWNAGNFASGVYYYRLDAKGLEKGKSTFTQVRKLLLIK